MNNLFFETILDSRNGLYIHAIEVTDTYEIENCIETIHTELFDDVANEVGSIQAKKQFIEFFESMEMYPLTEENEDEIFNFDVEDFINQII